MGPVSGDEGVRKYVEAGAVLGQVARARFEEVVRELADAGAVQRTNAQARADAVVDQVTEALRKSAAAGCGAIRMVSVRAGRTAEGVRTTAGWTASRAFAVATKVAPASRSATPGGPPQEDTSP